MTTERAERLKALYDLGVELSALRSVPEVLDTALAHCLDLTASQFGFIGLVDPDITALEIVAIRGFHPSRAFFSEHRTIPLRPNLFASVVLENQAARVDDAQTDPNRVGQPSGHPLVGTFLGVPLRFHDHAIGMIGVANRQSPYDDDHERLIDTYAAQVSIVIRNAQLNEALEEANEGLERTVAERTSELNAAKDTLARHADELRSVLTETVDVQEHERRRIARDLHDGVNQLLIGAMLELKAIEERLRGLAQNPTLQDLNTEGDPTVAGELKTEETDPQPAGAELSAGAPSVDPTDLPNSLSATLGILRQVEQEVRRVVNDLHPPTLETLGLPAAVKRLTERLARFFAVSCDVEVLGDARRVSARSEVAA
ncbi:MAG TPA: GAF domain-containing protein, partial [Actinobacteria bacterium]|nr:GAF domain-containing protein [Actinomycetota bacterium]